MALVIYSKLFYTPWFMYLFIYFGICFQIDEPNIFGNTALHMACHTGQDTVATELVNSGASINQPNYNGNTPLHLAAASSSGVLCLELLVNNGADVNVQVKRMINKKIITYWLRVIIGWRTECFLYV